MLPPFREEYARTNIYEYHQCGELNQNYNILLVAHKCIMMNYDMLDFALCNSRSVPYTPSMYLLILCALASSAIGIHFSFVLVNWIFSIALHVHRVCRWSEALQCDDKGDVTRQGNCTVIRENANFRRLL